MLLRPLLPLLLATALTTARAAIELPPTPHESTCQGFTFKELLFKDGKREIVYQLPREWSYRPRADGVQLTPPKASFAEAVIRVAPLPVPQPLDEKAIEAAKQAFLGSLPPGSQMVSIVKEERNPVLLDNKPSYELTATYQVLGETFLRSALFTNLSETQVSFSLTARKRDFEALHGVFRQSILSWGWRESTVPSETALAAGPAVQAPARPN
jgi:hypothetical protein